MADFSQWIGKQCNLVSKQGIRYTGVLVNVDHTVAKIQVSNVRSFGTEHRSAPVFIPPIEQPFPLIEFMANDLTDLRFDGPVPSVPQSPYTPVAQPVPPETSVPVALPTPPSPSVKTSQSVPPPQPSNQFTSFSAERAPPPVNVPPARAQQPTSTAQLGRTMGGMSLSNGQNEAPRGRGAHRGERGRGRGHGYGRHTAPIPAAASIPTTDFDFQSSNQRFDKKAAAQEHPALQPKAAALAENITVTVAENPTNGHTASADPKKGGCYDPATSFFDSISSDANKMKSERPIFAPAERGRARGRGRGRSRRDEERDRNVETFGEAGGIGLLGPGQYVGGFGGFRGRKRRGAPRGTGPGTPGGGGRGRGAPRAVVADA